MAQPDNDTRNIDHRYQYFVDYINEATWPRMTLRAVIQRAVLAYKQKPYRNTYRENANRYLQTIGGNSAYQNRYNCVKMLCDSIPDSTNDTVFNAVETFTSMAMGGASQFEYAPADDYLEKDSELVDRLSELAKFFYEDNGMDALIPKAVRKLVMQGQANFFIKPSKDGRFVVSLIDAYQMLTDPRKSKTNRERFIGFTETAHWGKLKDEIKEYQGRYYVEVSNDVDKYLEELQNFGRSSNGTFYNELRVDLDTFRSLYNTPMTHQSESVDKEGNPISPVEIGYKGDDIEVSYIWDTISKVYAIVVNRRFIVYTKENPFKKGIDITYFDSMGMEQHKKIDVEIDSPIVTVPFIEADWETYPVSPLFYCLDDFDAICSMESVMNHNFSISAPMTFMASAYDAEQFAMMGQVAGEIVEGTMNTLMVLPKAHDMSPIIAAIERREQRIKRMLGATDQFELQAMIGNRATASEVGAMAGAVSQRLNPILANIEVGMAKLAQKMMAMYIIFADDDGVVFPANGRIAYVSKQDMLGRSLITAKLDTRIKLEKQEKSRNALMILQTLIGAEGVNRANLVRLLVPLVMQGTVNRRQADSIVDVEEEIDPAMIQQLVQQQQQAGPAPIIDPTMLDSLSPQDLEGMIGGVSGAFDPTMSAAMPNQFGGMTSATEDLATGEEAVEETDAEGDEAVVDTGADNFEAGLEANDQYGLV